jgi:outer membrane protein TolC
MWKFCLTFLLTFSALAAGEDLSLRQAADLLTQHNPVLQQKKLDSEISHKQWGQARAMYLPEVNFTQSWIDSNNPVYVFGSLLNQQKFGPDNFRIDALNNPDSLTDYSSKFQLGWLLFDFGKRESRVNIAATGSRMADLQQQAVRANYLQELVRRYYAVSLAKQRLDVTESALKSAESRMNQAQQRFDQGMSVKSDLLSAEVFVSSARQQRIDADYQNRLAIAALRELLATDAAPTWETKGLEEREFPDPGLPALEQQMKENRPELKWVAEARKQSSSQVKVEGTDFAPSLQAWSAYEWHGSSFDYSGSNWGAGIELRWNLFRGFSDALQLSEAKLRNRQMEEKQREMENAFRLELQTAYYHYQSAVEKYGVAKGALDQAAENERIYSERYAAGLVSIQDSLAAENSYKETRLMVSQNLYDVYVAYAQLLAAAGQSERILDTFEKTGVTP